MNTQELDRHTDLIASDRVEGTAVYNHDGERLGKIENFMVGKRSGQVEHAVMSFGGFLGMGEDYYPIPWQKLTYDTDKGGYVVDIDKAQLDDAPRYTADHTPEYDQDYNRRVYDYYGVGMPVI
jgi:sporulation protein YlmC with PRC-barrel domain